jgi:hypothetical protein
MWRVLLVAAALIPKLGWAADYLVSQAQSAGEVKCLAFDDGWFFSTTGPCTDFQAPRAIALGQAFSEGGKTHVIHRIVATQVEQDYEYQGWSIKRGQWICVAAESPDDWPDMKKDHKRWLYIPQCIPVR